MLILLKTLIYVGWMDVKESTCHYMHVEVRELLGVCSFLLACIAGSNISFQAYMTSALTH